MITTFSALALTVRPVRQMKRDESARNLPALTSLRGIAALTVLVFHAAPRFRGYLAVDLFFLLSGFVLMHAYGQMNTTRQAYLSFLKCRLARIYPVHLLILIVLLPMLNVQPAFSWGGLVSSLMLLQSPWQYSMCWNGASWSISAEWHAYLLFPFLAATYRTKSSDALFLTLAVCATVVSLTDYVLGSGNITNSPLVLVRCLPEFIAGMVLYRLREEGSLPEWISSDIALWAAAATIIGLEVFKAPDGAIICFLALVLITSASNRGHVVQLLNRQPLKYLGNISYSLYMVQFPCLMFIDWFFTDLTPIARDFLFIGTSVALAAVISHFVEYPARDWVKGLTFRRVEWFPTVIAAGRQEIGRYDEQRLNAATNATGIEEIAVKVEGSAP